MCVRVFHASPSNLFMHPLTSTQFGSRILIWYDNIGQRHVEKCERVARSPLKCNNTLSAYILGANRDMCPYQIKTMPIEWKIIMLISVLLLSIIQCINESACVCQ